MKTYTAEQVARQAAKLVKKYPSIAAAAEDIGCDRAQMSRAVAGKGPPAPAVLEALGLERRVLYVKA